MFSVLSQNSIGESCGVIIHMFTMIRRKNTRTDSSLIRSMIFYVARHVVNYHKPQNALNVQIQVFFA